MHQDVTTSPKKPQERNRNRLKLAIDILLDHILQLEGENKSPQEEGLGASRNSASKSDRFTLLPPPDASS